jgi:hypothetical protein
MPGIRRRAQVRQTILKSERYLVHYLVGRKRDQRRCPTPQCNGASSSFGGCAAPTA